MDVECANGVVNKNTTSGEDDETAGYYRDSLHMQIELTNLIEQKAIQNLEYKGDKEEHDRRDQPPPR